ncbi:putative membrane protein SirB2 [Pseudoteredinibacter isoporae]|uniref:Putative membrane protein SirB2 n=2 Tax=Pseudoteredinibacter isoporae TaxID=570281 RepID=A0A7X0JUM0_9GAMM|nr:putative membrane protein SirB2 [Pseudoteredinibacter isoporae]
MSSMYPALKHLHMTLALISICGFMLRAFWSLRGSDMLQKRWVKISPHIVDTFLLLSAIGLVIVLQLSPHNQPWLLSKVFMLFLYIGFGVVALKHHFPVFLRAIAATCAILIFFLIANTAFSKLSPLQAAGFF